MKVEESRYFWFFTSCTRPYVLYFDKELYVSLTYYQKGNSYLQINGKAFIENTNKGFSQSDPPQKNQVDHVILLKVRILKAEYFEPPSEKISIMNKIKSAVTHLLHSRLNKVYDFSS